VPDLPVDPNDILRSLDRLRGTIGGTASIGETLSRAAEGAQDVSAAINRLADEAAKLNENFDRYGPVLQAIEQQISKTTPMLDSVQSITDAIRSRIARPQGDKPGDNPER
jgi:hypothetical protein